MSISSPPLDRVYFAEGSPSHVIDESGASEMLDEMLRGMGPLRRVLLIPPDVTRWESWAGPLTVMLFEKLSRTSEVVVMPALGTHEAMSEVEREAMFPGIPEDRFRVHRWRSDLVRLGEVTSAYVREVSEGSFDAAIPIEINRLLLDGEWDRIISIGQLIPHEVIGIANHVKNVLIGVGGAETIHKSHYVGAAYGMERIMGKIDSPVRSILQYGMDQFLADLPITYLLTVRGFQEGHLVTRGLYAGDGRECYRIGAPLVQKINMTALERSPRKVIVWLDPKKFKSTWLGNKAIYRTRMAIADGGELIVLAPGVKMFGEDEEIDRLIRRFGYRGTPETQAAVATDRELSGNLAAAAHLIHGSTEGRFRVTYCPGGLSAKEIEDVGYAFGDLAEHQRAYDPSSLREGWNNVSGEEIYFISQPGQGLWTSRARQNV